MSGQSNPFGDSAKSSSIACDVTEAAMLAALEAAKDGPNITGPQAAGIMIGLTRAAARWGVMMAGPEMDGGWLMGFEKCLQQERQRVESDSAAGRA